MKSQKVEKPFRKVVNEIFRVKEKQGGGIIKIEAWEDTKGNIVKYSLAYINPFFYPDDNGRVLGYDNVHNYHHKHYYGEITPVDDFVSYQDIVERFETELREFAK